MSIADYSKFQTYKKLIQSIPVPFDDDALINDQFLLEKDDKKKLEIYYAPFEYVNENAKVVIVGITPGLHQMKKSYSTVLNVMDQQISDEEILHEVKKNSSFEGPMRKNLIQMLDELGLNHYLGLSSSSELFGAASHMVQTMSVLPYPVFYNGKNYSGSTPDILKTEVLKRHIIDYTAGEINKLNDPLIIPLGVNVSKVLMYLADNGYITKESILIGFPHSSGANGNRHKQFATHKENMQRKLQDYFG
ncbi:hypothetical protein [Paenisporosarcina antarctica]|uniref:Uracil-DNA glycosylase-like domain-containing protein n=1 Tax=Paenisporosarcina antarctica TaxID=417367 RepID=A0A4P6ZV77_9BACL|nr:hypothetical protein [Paenisporosarcina antarctica]QBP40177.1 hypothetical protein E2636_02985 [Paenisporosarcina antarctica]